MWIANFEDGSSTDSKKMFWTQLHEDQRTKGKLMKGLQLSHPFLPRLYLNLNGYDRYYYVQDAIGIMQGSQVPIVIAEIIGAHDLKLGTAVEVRLSRTGSVNVKLYSVRIFKYSPSILFKGSPVGEPSYTVTEGEAQEAHTHVS